MSHLIGLALIDAAKEMEDKARRIRRQAEHYLKQPTWPMQWTQAFKEVRPDDDAEELALRLGCSVKTAELAIQEAQRAVVISQTSERTKFIIEKVCQGWTNKEIAARLGCHVSTISKTVASWRHRDSYIHRHANQNRTAAPAIKRNGKGSERAT